MLQMFMQPETLLATKDCSIMCTGPPRRLLAYFHLLLLPSRGRRQHSLSLLCPCPLILPFLCGHAVQPIYEELGEQTEKAMKKVAHVSQIIVTSIYCGAAMSSYLLFGDATASDVLANFDADLGVPKVRLFFTTSC